MTLHFILIDRKEICCFEPRVEDQLQCQFTPVFSDALSQLRLLRDMWPNHKYSLHTVNTGEVTNVDGESL